MAVEIRFSDLSELKQQEIERFFEKRYGKEKAIPLDLKETPMMIIDGPKASHGPDYTNDVEDPIKAILDKIFKGLTGPTEDEKAAMRERFANETPEEKARIREGLKKMNHNCDGCNDIACFMHPDHSIVKDNGLTN